MTSWGLAIVSNTGDLEKKLWEAADELRANSKLRSYNPEGAAAFLNLGGFISGVAVGARNYLGGVDRQAVLKALLVDREKLSIDPNLPLVVKRQRFRQRALVFHSEEPASDDGVRHARGAQKQPRTASALC